MKQYKLKQCPECGKHDVRVVSKENIPLWKCDCGWEGKRPKEIEVSEDEYLKYAEELQ